MTHSINSHCHFFACRDYIAEDPTIGLMRRWGPVWEIVSLTPERRLAKRRESS
jgi:hypothetical protein